MPLTAHDFRDQHLHLLALSDHLLTLVHEHRLETSAESAYRAIQVLWSRLHLHLEAEEQGIYRLLAESPQPDVRATAATHAAGLSAVKQAFLQYLYAWGVKAISDSPLGFMQATEQLVAKVRTQIEREEHDLYPLVPGMRVSADDASAAPSSPARVVFVIDDNPGDVTLLTEAWSETKVSCHLHHFPTAEAFLHHQDSRPPDLIIVDVHVPITNGPQLVRQLRALERYRHVPVVLCSSASHSRESTVAEEAGAQGFYVKPERFHEYPALIKTMNDLMDFYHRPDVAPPPSSPMP